MEVPFWRCDWSDCRYLATVGEQLSNPCKQGKTDIIEPMMMKMIEQKII